jgi:3-isopropylmalate/(R)-2-methylmalate dehydratase small subunit
LTVDLEAMQVRSTNSSFVFAFDVAASRRERMLNGWDDISLTLKHSSAIAAFEAKHFATQPWLA